MLTDAMLREAAAEVERFLLSTVPEEGESHVFSKRFERRISKLIRRANHPIRYKVMRAAAVVVLVIATLFGTVMAVSPEARAAVVGWVKSAFYEFFEYSNEAPNTNNTPTDENNDANNPTSEPVKYEYCLSVVPEGYRELRIVDRPDGRTYLYVNESGNILQFSYTYGTVDHSTFIEIAKYKHSTVTVHGISADVYVAVKLDETNVIVWQDINSNVLFRIHAYFDQAGLIKLAEGVN